MDKYLLVLQIQNPDNFEDIFGSNITLIAKEDISEGFRSIAYRLMERCNILSDVISPFFGLWYVSFSFKQSNLPVDINEQLQAIPVAGKESVRAMFQDNFGMTTGTNVEFKLAIIPAQKEILDINRISSYIETSLAPYSCAGKSYVAISRDEFTKIIERQSIEIYLQPIISLRQETIVGYEALSRGPANSTVQQAADLFRTASHFGLKEELEMVCISKAFDWVVKLPKSYWLSINISPQLLIRPNFYDFITQHYFKNLLPRIAFEITEHLPIPISGKFQKVVQDLKGQGVFLILDDTGCGFADMGAVEILHPKIVKLCITVVRRIGRHPHIGRDIRITVDKIAKLGGEVLGEGVERREQVEVLRNNGVSFAQGYYYGRPKPARDVVEA